MKIADRRGLITALLISLAFLTPRAPAQPPLPPLPLGYPLEWWRFDDTNRLTTRDYQPISFTNIDLVPDWNTNALQLDSTNVAWLQYNVVENDGHTNLPVRYGSARFWFLPNWSSTDQGGTGPGVWGRLIDVGAYTSNASYGWWSLYLDPAGTNLYFSSQTNNGSGTNYLTFPVSWDSVTWHQIALTYSPTNTALYLDGAFATNGPGISIVPGADVLTNGLFIGSDYTGTAQAHGLFDDLWTFSYPLDSNNVAANYAYFAPLANPPLGGGSFMDGSSSFSPSDEGTNNYSTNLWLWIGGVSSNFVNLVLVNTTSDVLYEIQSVTNPVTGSWVSEGFVYGSEMTNWTPMDVAQGNRPDLFMRIRSWADSTGTSIPDWWWLQYFGQTTNVDAYAADPAGDGYTDLQKFQMGIAPGTFYNTNAPGGFFGCLDSTQTNVFLEWSRSPGPVVNYLVQRGVQNTITGNYVFTQIGTVNSNTTFFEDVGAISNANAWNNIYNLEALYPSGALTATDTWYAFYGEFGYTGAPYGAPMPGNVYAYAPSSGTNVLLSWAVPAPGAAPTNYIIKRGVLNTNTGNYVYSQIAALNTNTTYLQDVGAITNANARNDIYEVEAEFPGGVLSQPSTASIRTNLPTPTGVSAVVDSTGANVLITWTPPQGIVVSNYIIERGIFNTNTGNYSYSQIGNVNSNTTSFVDAGAITGNNSYKNAYEVEAEFPGGGASGFDSTFLPGPPPALNANIYVTANLIRNGTGRWQVMFSGLHSNSAQTIQLTWSDSNGNVLTTKTISTTNLINGSYQIPDTDVVNLLGDYLSVQLFGINGEPGQVTQAGFVPNDAPYFVDGRRHIKQNLNFLIRGASMGQTFLSSENGNLPSLGDPYQGQYNQIETNFEEFSFLHHAALSNNLEEILSVIQMDNLWPFTANYELANYFVDTSDSNYPVPFTNISFLSTRGVINFTFLPNFATNIPAPAILTHADPFWILQPSFGPYYDPYDGEYPNTTNWNITSADFYASVPQSMSFASGGHNLFGLPFSTGCIITYYPNTYYQSFGPGDNLTIPPTYPYPNQIDYTSWCPAPNLQLVNYYFAPLVNPGISVTASFGYTPTGVVLPGEQPGYYYAGQVQPSPLPIEEDFNVTNQTPPLIVGTVGQPMILAGWAKYSVSNSSPTKYAYLGQYFATNAFLLNADGTATTNSAGILSPYGEFFPLQAGVAELVTMPDIDTGQQGTNVVHVVSLNVDANHDGTMDFSYAGPDQNSSSRPFRFWANDVNDAGDDGGDGIPGQGAQGDGMIFSYADNGLPLYLIQGSRNLVNFFPVYLNIGSLFRSNAWSAGISVTDTNYQFVLSQADGALRFAYTDLTPTNYMNFLKDTNEVFDYLHDTSLTTVRNLNSGGVPVASYFLSQIAGNSGGIILVEAWTNTTQPLVLTIYHGTNQIAQTSLFLSISGVEQMFRSKTIVLSPHSGTVADRLTDASVPNEPDTIDKNFVLVHGYNVNPQQARGWGADIYKRLYWSGSHAKFYALTWEAYDSQHLGQVTINLQTNIVNAFLTATNFATFIGTLTNGPTVVAAHSLGNMLVLATLNDCTNISFDISQFFMIDAAVPIEAIQGSATADAHLYYPDWIPYADKLNASHWWQLFSTNDARRTLTWNNRLANFGDAEVYNFYSSGEEVLREYTNSNGGYPPPELEGSLDQVSFFIENETFNIGLPVGAYTWSWEEMLKGRGTFDGLLSSSHGGWKFNTNAPYTYVTNGVLTQIPDSDATLISNSQLQTNAFFDVTSASFGTNDMTLFGASGSAYALAHRNRILSDAIPALTLPIGANPVSSLTPPGQPNRNVDMQTIENGWPSGRQALRVGATAAGEWHHSDCRQVAYTFTYRLFTNIVTSGGLQ